MRKTKYKKSRYILSFTIIFLIIALIVNDSKPFLRIAYPQKFSEYVFEYADRSGIDPYLVFAIIKAESSFNPDAISPKNARGLMQISKITGEWGADSLGIKQFTVESLFDPDVNVSIGCWYIGRLMKEYKNDMELVITAYNCGSGNVNEWLKDKNYSISGSKLDRIPFEETDRFLKRVKNYHTIYKRLYDRN